MWKYNLISLSRELRLPIGVEIATTMTGDDRVAVAELPAGRYLQTVRRGHPSTLEYATNDLLAYARKQRLTFDCVNDAGAERWASRLEFDLTDPATEPGLNAWETMLASKLAG